MKKVIYVVSSIMLPMVAFAEGINTSGLETSIDNVSGVINKLIPLVIGAGVLVFLWGVLMYVLAQGESEKREEGKKFMIWGIVALFVMTSVWGLVKLLQSTAGVGNSTAPSTPKIPTS